MATDRSGSSTTSSSSTSSSAVPTEVREELEKDVNAAVKQVLSEMEIAARTAPADACHPYACDARRKVVIRAFWSVYKRCMQSLERADAATDAGGE